MSEAEQLTSRLLTVRRDAPVRWWSAKHWTVLAVVTVTGLGLSFAIILYVGLTHSPRCGETLPVESRALVQGAYIVIAAVPYALVLPFRPWGRLLIAASITSSFTFFSLVSSFLDPDRFFGPVFCF
jgi:hypothetical protein